MEPHCGRPQITRPLPLLPTPDPAKSKLRPATGDPAAAADPLPEECSKLPPFAVPSPAPEAPSVHGTEALGCHAPKQSKFHFDKQLRRSFCCGSCVRGVPIRRFTPPPGFRLILSPLNSRGVAAMRLPFWRQALLVAIGLLVPFWHCCFGRGFEFCGKHGCFGIVMEWNAIRSLSEWLGASQAACGRQSHGKKESGDGV